MLFNYVLYLANAFVFGVVKVIQIMFLQMFHLGFGLVNQLSFGTLLQDSVRQIFLIKFSTISNERFTTLIGEKVNILNILFWGNQRSVNRQCVLGIRALTR